MVTFAMDYYPQILLGVVLCNLLLLVGLYLDLILPSCLELFVLSIFGGGNHDVFWCVTRVRY